MKKKKIILIIIVAVVLIFSVYKIFFKQEETNFTLEQVQRGTIIQEVSESGTVGMGEEINLGFKNGGRIEKIYVKVGDVIKSGQALAKIDTVSLSIQLADAQASLGVAKAQLQISQTSATNGEISLKTAQQNLNDVTISANDNLDNAHEDSLSTLNDAYLKIYNAFDTVKTIQQAYLRSPTKRA